MKRSEINRCIQEAKEICTKHGYILPPWAYFSPDDWAQKGAEYDEIRENMLGWDVTDFGLGDFEKTGLLLFTIRNGNYHKPGNRKTYAEKLMLVKNRQVTPTHFHWSKMEDIINRGGGNLQIQVYNSTQDEKLADTPVNVMVDGRHFTVTAGTIITLQPGESITLPQNMYHQFWAEKGKGTVLCVEVSAVNDDNTDNRFLEPLGRFPEIEEDEEPKFLLCNEYPPATD